MQAAADRGGHDGCAAGSPASAHCCGRTEAVPTERIAGELGISPNTVRKWRGRFAAAYPTGSVPVVWDNLIIHRSARGADFTTPPASASTSTSRRPCVLGEPDRVLVQPPGAPRTPPRQLWQRGRAARRGGRVHDALECSRAAYLPLDVHRLPDADWPRGMTAAREEGGSWTCSSVLAWSKRRFHLAAFPERNPSRISGSE